MFDRKVKGAQEVPQYQAPLISKASIDNSFQNEESDEGDVQVAQPVINFNGIMQVGY